MSAADSTFFTLNEVATEIWQAADGQTPLSEIVAQTICHKFDAPLAEAEYDAEVFAEDLARHGILVISDKPIPSSPVHSGTP